MNVPCTCGMAPQKDLPHALHCAWHPANRRPVPAPSPASAAEFIAQQFHSTYEALAPYEGYRTRDSSAVPWDEVPEVNRRLMVRTVETLLRADVIRQGDNRADSKDV